MAKSCPKVEWSVFKTWFEWFYDNDSADPNNFILNDIDIADIHSQLGQSNKVSTLLQDLSFRKKVCGAETGSGC
jgi:hypothetical protein